MRRHALMGSWLKREERKKRKGKLRASAYRAPPKCDFQREKRNWWKYESSCGVCSYGPFLPLFTQNHFQFPLCWLAVATFQPIRWMRDTSSARTWQRPNRFCVIVGHSRRLFQSANLRYTYYRYWFEPFVSASKLALIFQFKYSLLCTIRSWSEIAVVLMQVKTYCRLFKCSGRVINSQVILCPDENYTIISYCTHILNSI